MRALLLLIIFFSIRSGYPQSIAESDSYALEYKWLNSTFPIDTLYSYEGERLILSDNSKIYVIHFWFTSCPPCIVEIKWLNKLKDEYASEELDFLAVSFEGEALLKNFLKSHEFKFKQFHLDQQVINEKHLTIGYPTSIIIDKNGKVIFQKSGGYSEQEKAIETYQLLSKEIEKIGLSKH